MVCSQAIDDLHPAIPLRQPAQAGVSHQTCLDIVHVPHRVTAVSDDLHRDRAARGCRVTSRTIRHIVGDRLRREGFHLLDRRVHPTSHGGSTSQRGATQP